MIVSIAAPMDVPTDLGSPDTGAVDRPTVDATADGPACGAAALCESSAVTVTLPGGRFTGTTSGSSTDRGTCGGNQAPEAVFKLVLTQKSDVFVTTHGTTFDTVIYMRNGCCGSEVACNDDLDNRKERRLLSRVERRQRQHHDGKQHRGMDRATDEHHPQRSKNSKRRKDPEEHRLVRRRSAGRQHRERAHCSSTGSCSRPSWPGSPGTGDTAPPR